MYATKKKKGWKVALGEWQVEDKLEVQLSYECLGFGWIILYKVQGAIKSFLKKLINCGKTLWMGYLMIYLGFKT
jgi:hypothetical protein